MGSTYCSAVRSDYFRLQFTFGGIHIGADFFAREAEWPGQNDAFSGARGKGNKTVAAQDGQTNAAPFARLSLLRFGAAVLIAGSVVEPQFIVSYQGKRGADYRGQVEIIAAQGREIQKGAAVPEALPLAQVAAAGQLPATLPV